MTKTVTVPLAALVRSLVPPGGSPPSLAVPAGACAVSGALMAEFDAASHNHTQFDFCLRLLWLNTVDRLEAVVGTGAWAAALPTTTRG